MIMKVYSRGLGVETAVVIFRYSAKESKQNPYTANQNRLSTTGNEMGYIPKAIYPHYNYANEIAFAPVT
jgi:hypothetical protein